MSLSAPKKSKNMSSNEEADQHIYNAIVDAIMNRQIGPGTRLVEAPLCKAFGVTRGVLRRVFVKLAHDRVIEIQPNRGAVVPEHDFHETEAIFEARSMLEIGTVKKLARKHQQLDFSELKALIKKEEQVRSAGNLKEWIKLSGDFHIRLCEANHNPIVTGYLHTLIARTSLLIGMYETKPNHCSVEEHYAILEAIELGDEQKAIKLMDAHLGEYARTFLDDQPDTASPNLIDIFQNKMLHK